MTPQRLDLGQPFGQVGAAAVAAAALVGAQGPAQAAEADAAEAERRGACVPQKTTR